MTAPGALRVAYRSYRYWRRFPLASLFGTLLQPLLYVGAMGIGVGALVDDRNDASALGGSGYLAFITPGLMVTSAMMIAATEMMWPLLDGFRWGRGFHAAAATTISPAQLADGTVVWVAARALSGAAAVALVVVWFDEVRTPALIPAAGIAAVAALAVAAPIGAWTATRDRDVSMPVIMRFGLFPMFLLSGAFFPIAQLPVWARAVAWATPPFHGIELARGLTIGGLDGAAALGHVAVLAAFLGGGYAAMRVTFRRVLHR